MEIEEMLKQVLEHRDTVRLRELIEAAMNGQPFTPEQIVKLRDILDSEPGREKLFDYVEYFGVTNSTADCKPAADAAQALADSFAQVICNDRDNKYANKTPSYRKDSMKEFLGLFPRQAYSMARAIIEDGRPMTDTYVHTLSTQLTDEQWRNVIPHDVLALTAIVRHLGESMGDEFYDMVQRLHEKDPNHGQWSLGNTSTMEMMEVLKPEHKAYVMKNFTKLFRPNQVNILHARVILETGGNDRKTQTDAVRKLARTAQTWRVKLKDSFEIPQSETGEALCAMLVYLEQLDRTDNKGKIAGIPTEDQFRQRALEVQMSDPHRYKQSAEARDRLESASRDCLDAINELKHAMEDVCKAHKHPEELVLESLDRTDEDPHTKATLARLTTLTSRHDWNSINDCVLWGEGVADKQARELLDVMSRAGLLTKRKENTDGRTDV